MGRGGRSLPFLPFSWFLVILLFHNRGEDAEEELEKEGLRVSYLQLDIEDVESIDW